MKVQRRNALQVALFSCLALAFIALTLPDQTTAAQQKQGSSTAQPTPVPARPSRLGQESEQVTINTDLITLTVTVTDSYGRYVSGLDQSAFTVLDDKEPQNIAFFSDEDAPVSVGIIFDVSGSMGGDKLKNAREALSHFIETSHEMDEYFLIGFNTRAQLLLDRTRNGNAVIDKLTFVEPKHNTALYDACYLGVEKITRGTHPKRAILLISDGQDNESRYTFSDLRRLLKETDVVLYSIGIVGVNDANSALGMQGQSILDELSSVSGGKAFFPSTDAEMNEIFERIALELRHQYSIGYKPANFINDGRWHKIKVKVQPPRGLPRLFVRSKEGYFALANPR